MLKSIAVSVALATSALVTTSSFAADCDGACARAVEVDVERGRGYHDDDRWRHRGPRVGIVIGDNHRGNGYCRSWRHECADRWGWGGYRFRRCLDRHGC